MSQVQSLVRIVLSADNFMTFVSAEKDYDWTLRSECVFQTTVKPPKYYRSWDWRKNGGIGSKGGDHILP